MSWKINGHDACPTRGRWMGRPVVDIQGDGRPIYPAMRSFQLEWRFTNFSEWANAQAVFDDIQSTGTTVVEIPTFPTTTGSVYGFTEYSGVFITEPEIGPFFAGYPSRMIIIISNIRIE
ncbi:hypothetical protein LCGC14_0508600 [marine sediment metagenome]|uniref:Uncharacterized protein n=1 Tax=marine sediment metagenome TaxID=412755 RepID=A0A0F9UNG0_9ZZZZ